MSDYSNDNVEYDSSYPLHGAFYHIQEVTKTDDIAAAQYVKVSVSSSQTTNFTLPILKKDESDSYFQTQVIENSWYEVDLIHNYLIINRYVLRANKIDYFKEWDILGSLDGVKYFVIDHQENISTPTSTLYTSDYLI